MTDRYLPAARDDGAAPTFDTDPLRGVDLRHETGGFGAKLGGAARQLLDFTRRKLDRRRHTRTRLRSEGDLLDWGRKYLPNHFTRRPSAMHEWLAERLDQMLVERGGKLNVIGPRGAAKSTIASLACPLRLALEEAEPYIWIISDTKEQARTHLENVKAELTTNPLLAADYPRAAGKAKVSRETTIVLANGVVIEAFGTGQGIRGRRRGFHRPTMIICDDLQSDQHIDSALQRDHSRRWFHGTLLKAGNKRTNVVNLATALHVDALALELHRTPGWTSRIFRAIERWPEHMSLWSEWESIYANRDLPEASARAREFYHRHRAAMDAGAELLWPDEEDLYTLMSMRAESGRTAFEREKQGSPINPESCEWPEDYFGPHLGFDEWPEGLRAKTMALDPSKGRDARRGDYSAYVLLGVGADDCLYVEADLARRATPRMVADGVGLWRRHQPDAFGVEANQYQELLSGEFAREFRRAGLLGVHPWSIDNRVNKLVRIRRLGPYLASGKLRFKRDSPSTHLLIEQLRAFPIGDHDDGPDALEMALRLALELLDAPVAHDNIAGRLDLD